MYMDNSENQNDLIQEIVLQLWKSFERFEGNSQFSTWMYRVSLNTALTYFKKEKKKEERHTFIENIDQVDEVDSGEKETQLELFYKAVHELNKVEKALIFLFLEGQSHKEIASNLGITEVNARVKLNRTKEKIQNIIKTYGYEF
ncbi:RNA polymerase sigma factor [Empedobacter brevis]|uniref:RNA polymerase sigma factor n=1 Tax=Empedobacter brevis TaxID=247 RepID=UPI0035E3F34F